MDFEIDILSNVSDLGELQMNVRKSIKRDLLNFKNKRVHMPKSLLIQ